MGSKGSASTLSLLAINVGLVLGPHVGYFFQLVGMLRSRNITGYARLVSFILLCSYTLRIFYFFGEPFEEALLWQAVMGVLVHLGMIFVVLRLEQQQLAASLHAPLDSVNTQDHSYFSLDSEIRSFSHSSWNGMSTGHENLESGKASSPLPEESPGVDPTSSALLPSILRHPREGKDKRRSSNGKEDGREDVEDEDKEDSEGGKETTSSITINARNSVTFTAGSSPLGDSVEKLAILPADQGDVEGDDVKKMKTSPLPPPHHPMKKKKKVEFQEPFAVEKSPRCSSHLLIQDTTPDHMCGVAHSLECTHIHRRCFLLQLLLAVDSVLESKVHGVLPFYFLSHYILSTVSSAICIALYYYVMRDVVRWWPGGASVIGYISLGCEATLVLPQILKNVRRQNTCGLNRVLVFTWISGDFIKVMYFLLLHQPLPFLLCGIFQLCLDFIVVLQLLTLPSTSTDEKDEVAAAWSSTAPSA